MFQATILSIFRSIRLYITACGMLFLHHLISNWQSIGYNIPQAVMYSLMLLKMDKIVA